MSAGVETRGSHAQGPRVIEGRAPLAEGGVRRGITVRRMAHGDCARVVELHVLAFRGFFLTSLGARFLWVLYSEAVRAGEIAIVAAEHGAIVGFVIGSAEPGRFFRELLRRRLLAFAAAAAAVALRQPRVAMRLLRALRKPREAARPPGTATLLSLGVDPAAQGSGAGRLLVHAFVEEARRRGATRVDLTTDKLENERTNGFYRRLGFTVAREIATPEGRVLNEYELEVGPAPGAQPRAAPEPRERA